MAGICIIFKINYSNGGSRIFQGTGGEDVQCSSFLGNTERDVHAPNCMMQVVGSRVRVNFKIKG